jgi:hypothetical protein
MRGRRLPPETPVAPASATAPGLMAGKLCLSRSNLYEQSEFHHCGRELGQNAGSPGNRKRHSRMRSEHRSQPVVQTPKRGKTAKRSVFFRRGGLE